MKRILIPIVGQGSITHIIRTGMLDQLSTSITPVIAMLWDEAGLVTELQKKGFEVVQFPEYKVSDLYTDNRGKIDMWYKKYKLRTPSAQIQERHLSQYKKKDKRYLLKNLRKLYYNVRFSLQPQFINQLVSTEKEMIQEEPVYQRFANWLDDLQIDGLFTVTPFLHQVDLIARIIKEQGKPLISSIHSFDNVTKRGWQSVVFDYYIVWNKYNKAELERIHQHLKENNAITIAGAPQFDFHFNENYCWSREEWLQRQGLPEGKKIILYSGGSAALFPHEPQYLKALKEAFEKKEISNDHIVLFRCHPLDKVERWEAYVGKSPFIVYDNAPSGKTKLDYVDVKDEDIIKLIATLKYTDVHINIASTMAVDGSVFNKPQIGPYYDDVNPATQDLMREMYYQEHYMPIMNTGVVHLAHSKSQYVDLVNKALEKPSTYTQNCLAAVKEIITFTDGRSSVRAASAIQKFFEG